MTLFSQVASRNHANPTQQQESDLEKKMRDTSGRKCLEQFGRFSRHGSWAKTFSALLIGMGDWYSTRCRLTWKLKGTKYNRMYFQLYPSTLPTEGIEFGLLPTPTVIQGGAQKVTSMKKDNTYSAGLHDLAYSGLLPTPQAMDCMTNPRRDITPSGRIISNQGHNGSAPLKDLAMNGLLPTPTAMDSLKNGDMTAAAKMMYGATHRASGQQIQKTLTDAIYIEYLKNNPQLAQTLAEKPMLKRTNLPSQQDFVKWIRQTTPKELSMKSNISLSKVEHWFRKDKVGFSHPSIEDWNVIKIYLMEWEKWDHQMTHQESNQWMGLLPTPTAIETPRKPERIQELKEKNLPLMSSDLGDNNRQMGILDTMDFYGMLPTVQSRDWKGMQANEYKEMRGEDSDYKMQSLPGYVASQTGQTSQLSPLFTLEMMGFPTDWTLLPFLKQSGETNQSKPQEMQ